MKGTILFAETCAEELTKSLLDIGLPLKFLGIGGRMMLFELIKEAEILVVRSKTVVNETLLKSAPELKLVIRMGAGIENIDVQALKERNIRLITTPEGNRDAVGEQALGMLLSLFNKIYKADKALRNFEWKREESRGIEIGGKTIGIIGYGNTGQAFAKRLSSFNARVIAYDTAFNSDDEYTQKIQTQIDSGNSYSEMVSLDEILSSSYVISLHIPLTNENRFYFNYEFIQKVSQPFWFLNLSRGEVVQTSALIAGLEQKKILGAGLDVFENENFQTLTEIQAYEFKALTLMDNVILTPHTGGVTIESEMRMTQLVRKAIMDYIFEVYKTL